MPSDRRMHTQTNKQTNKGMHKEGTKDLGQKSDYDSDLVAVHDSRRPPLAAEVSWDPYLVSL